MTEPTNKGKGKYTWWIVGGVLVVGIAVLVILLLLKKQKEKEAATGAGEKAEDDTGGVDKITKLDPVTTDPFDPMNPVDPPQPGHAYAVKKGDSMLLVIARAGFPKAQRHAAYLAMLKDPKNGWMGFNHYTGWKSLEDRQMFEPMPGHESKPYAYNTQRHGRTSTMYRRPVWRVPLKAEVPS